VSASAGQACHECGQAVRPAWIAGIHAGLGDFDNTIRYLEKSVYGADRGADTTYITWPPWFDGLANDPRFIAILKHMRLAT
jgi:hypothetical protein